MGNPELSEPSQDPEIEQDEPESNDPLAIIILALCIFMLGLSMLTFSALVVVKQGFNDIIWAFEVAVFIASTLIGIYLLHIAYQVDRRLKWERENAVHKVVPHEEIYEAWKKSQGH